MNSLRTSWLAPPAALPTRRVITIDDRRYEITEKRRKDLDGSSIAAGIELRTGEVRGVPVWVLNRDAVSLGLCNGRPADPGRDHQTPDWRGTRKG